MRPWPYAEIVAHVHRFYSFPCEKWYIEYIANTFQSNVASPARCEMMMNKHTNQYSWTTCVTYLTFFLFFHLNICSKRPDTGGKTWKIITSKKSFPCRFCQRHNNFLICNHFYNVFQIIVSSDLIRPLILVLKVHLQPKIKNLSAPASLRAVTECRLFVLLLSIFGTKVAVWPSLSAMLVTGSSIGSSHAHLAVNPGVRAPPPSYCAEPYLTEPTPQSAFGVRLRRGV